MPWFQCFIRGENFRLKIDNRTEDIGFYATRHVKAESATEAESLVLKTLKQEDSAITDVPEELKNPDARIYFDEIIEHVEEPDDPNKGFTFFPMNEESKTS